VRDLKSVTFVLILAVIAALLLVSVSIGSEKDDGQFRENVAQPSKERAITHRYQLFQYPKHCREVRILEEFKGCGCLP